jgi:hypothetical protein
MLAQAQEVFWEKTLAEKKKPLLISKLAAQVTWGYQTALEAMADGISKQVFEKNWQTLCQVKLPSIGLQQVTTHLPPSSFSMV